LVLRYLNIALLSFIFISCGGAGNTDFDVDTLSDAEIIAQFLILDLSGLPNYENIIFPEYYDDALFTTTDNTPLDNEISDEGATLGRVLFFDKSLSINDTISCSSCHKQELGFTDEAQFSVGFSGEEFTSAHSMRLANAMFYAEEKMFWNKRATSIEDQSTQPIKDHIEMGFDEGHGGIGALIEKMRLLPYYPILFKVAFGSALIAEDRIQRALAQYVRSLVSISSRWDEGYAQSYDSLDANKGLFDDVPGFTAEENLGKNLFMKTQAQGGLGCAVCHVPPTFSLADGAKSNGLDPGESVIFKAASLKNVALSGPYMHDGRFSTLEEVIEHYNTGIQAGAALDSALEDEFGGPIQLNLTEEQKAALLSFLQALTDNDLIIDPRYSDPFK